MSTYQELHLLPLLKSILTQHLLKPIRMAVGYGFKIMTPRKARDSQKNAMKNCNCDTSLIALPCRRPDLSPPENFFHLVRCKLKKDALRLNITKETYQEFKQRVIRTFIVFRLKALTRLSRQCPIGLMQLQITTAVVQNIKHKQLFICVLLRSSGPFGYFFS